MISGVDDPIASVDTYTMTLTMAVINDNCLLNALSFYLVAPHMYMLGLFT